MIQSLLRISWLALVRDRYALVLAFVVPIAFFSILALIFGGAGQDGLPPMRVLVADEDRSELSARLVRLLEREPALAVERLDAPADAVRAAADRMVREGRVPAAVVVPAEFGARLARFPTATVTVELVGDRTADPVAYYLVGGLVQRAVVLAAPDRLLGGVLDWIAEEAGPLTPAQREVLREVGEGLVAPDATATGPFRVVATDVRADRNRAGHNVVSYYAASIGVMFLLFTMVTATRGLGVEVETGTLERLLGTRVGMGQLLFARWLFAAALGCVQLIVMFGWAWMVFGVDVIAPGHAAGVLVMTVASAAAAAAFGLVLGTACRTPAQLQGLATVVILLMSALGGSMVPRYLMPEGMQRVGLLTFNAWAVVGFEKVLWRDQPVATLWPELAALGGMTLVGLGLARALARRWESS